MGTVNFKRTCAFKALPPRFISALIGMNVWQENKSPAAIGKTAGRSAQKGEKKRPKEIIRVAEYGKSSRSRMEVVAEIVAPERESPAIYISIRADPQKKDPR